MTSESVVFDKPISDPAVHPGTEGCPKEGDELYSKNGSAYYPISRFALEPGEILPPPTLDLGLVIEFHRDNEVLGGLNYDDVMVTEDIQKDYTFDEIKNAAIEDAVQIYGTVVELKVGDEMFINGKLAKILEQEDLDAISD